MGVLNRAKIGVSALVLLFCLGVCDPVYAAEIATSSDASGPVIEVIEDSYEAPMDMPERGSVTAFTDAVQSFALGEEQYVNCVYYFVSISGTEYVCLFPSTAESSLMVDSNNNLYNVSTSTVTGRLFEGSFDPLQSEGKLLYLTAALGNNFSTINNYGSPNYVREYYYNSSDRLTYDDTYVVVNVLDTERTYKSGDYLEYIGLFLIGCCLICLWKRS